MKHLVALGTALLVLPAISFAATYSATCPMEAQGIVEAVGGCAAINPTDYTAIYGKCCVVGGKPDTIEITGTTDVFPAPHSEQINWIGIIILGGLACGVYVGIRALLHSRQKKKEGV